MTHSISTIVAAELEAREALAAQVISIVHTGFVDANGSVKRGVVQNYIYQALGFQGRCGNHFARFINRIMEENGYRKSYATGQRVYYGLQIKNQPHSAE